MKQNTTVPEKVLATGDALTPAQQIALAALLAGETVTGASTAAAVDRSTVHRWLREDWDFIAAHNRGRQELQDHAQARLLLLAERALATVEEAIRNGDSRAALAVLKGLGLLGSRLTPIGADDPEQLQTEAETAEKRRHERWLNEHGYY